jgi:hypothetical protein
LIAPDEKGSQPRQAQISRLLFPAQSTPSLEVEMSPLSPTAMKTPLTKAKPTTLVPGSKLSSVQTAPIRRGQNPITGAGNEKDIAISEALGNQVGPFHAIRVSEDSASPASANDVEAIGGRHVGT